ncbi:MAG: hypothetical protein KDI30_08385 [Pseudomonadales bacterium]|nr:hypothetical protein [Pseudomonadales bacterium]
MSEFQGVVIVDDCAVLRTAGLASLEQASQKIIEAIDFARQNQLRKLMIDTLGFQAGNLPSKADRFFQIREWAYAARGEVSIALIVEEHLIDPERFGAGIAAISALKAKVFLSEVDAMQWLADVC